MISHVDGALLVFSRHILFVPEPSMADPKYAGLPGIDTNHPDTYETYSDHEVEGVIAFSYNAFLGANLAT